MNGDDFTKIKGIGIKVAEMLKSENIITYFDLANTTVVELKNLLVKYRMSKFRDPTNWPIEADNLIVKN